MNLIQKHIINTLTLDVNIQGEDKAEGIKKSISTFLQEKVLGEIESLLDGLNSGDDVIRFEKLTFDLEIETWEQRERIPAEFSQMLRRQLLDAMGAPHASVKDGKRIEDEKKGEYVTRDQNLRTTFLYFIEKGNLPWYGKRTYIDEMLTTGNWQRHLSDKEFTESLNLLLRNNKNALERFVLQLPDTRILTFVEKSKNAQFKEQIMENYFGVCSANCKNALLAYWVSIAANSATKTVRERLLDVYIQWFRESTQNNDDTADLIARFHKWLSAMELDRKGKFSKKEEIENIVLQGKGQHAFLRTKRGFSQIKGSDFENESTIVSKRPVSSVNEKEPLFFGKDTDAIGVMNAGQVLFLPFLKSFFQNLSWLEDDGKLKGEQTLRAAQALHFCATGRQDFFEAEMILEKFFCGLDLETPIPSESLLNEGILEEAENMLIQMILHWGALKNTSPEGLRQMFFQRDGKLIKRGSNFRLIVERKAQDVLLESVPWNYSMVKQAWLKGILFVEW